MSAAYTLCAGRHTQITVARLSAIITAVAIFGIITAIIIVTRDDIAVCHVCDVCVLSAGVM